MGLKEENVPTRIVLKDLSGDSRSGVRVALSVGWVDSRNQRGWGDRAE